MKSVDSVAQMMHQVETTSKNQEYHSKDQRGRMESTMRVQGLDFPAERITVCSIVAHNEIEEIAKNTLTRVLRERNVTGIWQPATTTVSKRFLGDFTAILSGNGGLEGIIALSMPRGVANKIASTSGTGSTEDAMTLLADISRDTIYGLNANDISFTSKTVVSSNDSRYPAPVPRRIIPFMGNKGNLMIEVYLRKPTFLGKKTKDWWEIGGDRIDKFI